MCAAGKVLEVILVSRDRDQDGFDEYFAMMPGVEIPFFDELINAWKNQGIQQKVELETRYMDLRDYDFQLTSQKKM